MYNTLWRKIECKILDPKETVSEKQKKMYEPWHLFPFRDHHCDRSALPITYLDIWHNILLWRITNNLYWKAKGWRRFCWWEHLISAWVLQLFEITFLAQTQLIACMLLHFSSTKHLSLHYYIYSILSLLAYNCISTVCISLEEFFEFQNVDMLCFSSRVGLSLLTLSLPASNKRKKEFGHFFSR